MGASLSVHWEAINHAAVGGVTDQWTHFATIDALPPWLDPPVPHSLGAIIDHKKFLRLCWSDLLGLALDDRLPCHHVSQDIKMPSRFSPAGHGSRVLGQQEICLAWDLPLWFSLPLPIKERDNWWQAFPPMKSSLAASDAFLQGLPLEGSPQGTTLLVPWW